MSVLVDTNVLLRRTQRLHETHAVAVQSVAHLLARGEVVYFTMQNIAEYWNVATRQVENNGLGLSAATVSAEVQKIEALLMGSFPTRRRCTRNGSVWSCSTSSWGEGTRCPPGCRDERARHPVAPDIRCRRFCPIWNRGATAGGVAVLRRRRVGMPIGNYPAADRPTGCCDQYRLEPRRG